MIKVRNIGMDENKNYRFYVHWDTEGVTFDVYRSNAPHSEFVKQDTTNVPFYIDSDVNAYDEGNKFYYYVIGFDRDGNEVGKSEIAIIQHGPKDYIANKVMKEARIILRVMKNPRSYLLINRREGEFCYNCWNHITFRTKFADCPVCFGTGKTKGYFPPVPIRLSTDMSQYVDEASFLNDEKITLTPVNAWTENYPLITPGDVIVDVTDRRFIVQVVIPRTKSQYIIRQILQMTPLEKGHPAYNVNVNRGEMQA